MSKTFYSPDQMRGLLPEFLGLYAQRPIKNNKGGMHLNHTFATWLILKWLAPKTVIESGIARGHSTWLIESTCPDARLFCLDPNTPALIYRSSKATYLRNDFADCPWDGVEKDTALCFFDDHQNAYQRLKDLKWAGFKRAIFEDNWPVGEGDNYSLKHMFAGIGHVKLQASKKYLGPIEVQNERAKLEKILYGIGPRQHLVTRPNEIDRSYFSQNCSTYFEVPPAALTKISTIWDVPYEGNYATVPPLYNENDVPDALRKIIEESPEELDYSYIAYVELK